MTEIAVFHDNHLLYELIDVTLRANFKVELVQYVKAEEFFESIDRVKNTSLILVGIDFKNPVAEMVYSLNNDLANIPVIYIVDSFDSHEKDFYQKYFNVSKYNLIVQKVLVKDRLVKKVDDILRQLELSEARAKVSEYHGGELLVPVAGYYLKYNEEIEEVYAKNDNNKLAKVTDLKSVKGARSELVYVSESQMKNLSINLYKEFIEDLNAKDDSELEQEVSNIKRVQDIARVIGLSDIALEKADEALDEISQNVSSNQTLAGVTHALMTFKDQFYTRIGIQNYIMSEILYQLELDTKSNLKKLVFSSVFCDFGFAKNQVDLAYILKVSDEKFFELEEEEKNLVITHPKISAEYLQKNISGLIGDEIKLISQHHAMPDGSGFPGNLNSKNMPPMLCIFVLSYHFATQISLAKELVTELDPLKILESLGPAFSKENFERPYKALKSSFEELNT